jgi:hypothetical protein
MGRFPEPWNGTYLQCCTCQARAVLLPLPRVTIPLKDKTHALVLQPAE